MNTSPQLPMKQELKSVVMFADISGFTNLTENYSKIGPEGNEIIAFAINRYMELMVQEIGKSGGDIFKFAGDAMIVLWPPPPNDQRSELEKEKFLMNSCHLAVQSAVNIQKKLKETKIVDNIMLSVKIGFGIGNFSIIYVGGVLNRAEYLPAGHPLIQAFECESHAHQGGVIIISQEVQMHLSRDNYFQIDEITEKEDKRRFYKVTHAIMKVRNISSSIQIKEQLSAQQIEIIRPEVEKYIPKALKSYVNLGVERWSSELRWLSILFMNIGIDLNDTEDKEGLNRIQKVIQCIQKCVYFQEGSLNKFLMDDKGSTMIIVFGLPPTSHEDDAARACLCARQIRKNLKRINIECSIGIASGLVFAGVVGTSGNRREYSVIGDTVNLSARIMSCACKEKEKKILVDEMTTKFAMNKIDFRFWNWKKFKGKSMYLPIYEPLFDKPEKLKKEYPDHYFPAIRTRRNCYPIWNPKYLDKPSADEPDHSHDVQPAAAAPEGNKDQQNQYQEQLLIPSNIQQMPFPQKLAFMPSKQAPQQQLQQSQLSKNVLFQPRFSSAFLSNVEAFLSENANKKSTQLSDVVKKQINLYKTIVMCEDQYLKAMSFFKAFMKGIQQASQLVSSSSQTSIQQQQQQQQFSKMRQTRCKGFALIRGPVGVGKSLFLRKLMISINEEVCRKKGAVRFKYDESLCILVSSLNSKTNKFKCNGMRPIIKVMFRIYLTRHNLATDKANLVQTLHDLIPSLRKQEEQHQKIILQLFGLEKINLLSQFDPSNKNPNEYSEDAIKKEYILISKLLREFFAAFLEQKEHTDSESASNSMLSSPLQGPRRSSGSFNSKNLVAPLIICLEDIHNFDIYSFKLIRTLLKYFDNILFFSTARTDYFERPAIVNPKMPLQQDLYVDCLTSIEDLILDINPDLFSVIELSNFQLKESNKLKELLKAVVGVEYFEFRDMQQKDQQETEEYTQPSNQTCYLFFSRIKEQIKDSPKVLFMYYLQYRTNGNPQTVLDFIDSLLSAKLLLLAGENTTQEELQKDKYFARTPYKKTAFITDQLKKMILCEQLLTVNAPLIKRKLYGPILDQLKTEELLIMKIASVIGDVFDLKTLEQVQPFKELLKIEQLVELIQNLQQIQFIEIVEHTTSNVYFRCSNPFIREVIYQRMDYSQRRQLHLVISEAMRSTDQLAMDELNEERVLIYHMRLGEPMAATADPVIQENYTKQIELKAKRAIIVKRVTRILKQNTNSSDRMCMLHSGIISKKSDRGVRWADRYVILTVYDIRYYHDINEFEDSPSECLASILLKDIIRFEKTSEIEGKTSFTLHAEKWYKKDQLKGSKRIFNFESHKPNIFEEWLIYIEYAKTFQQFNYFQQNFGKIQLPIDNGSANSSESYSLSSQQTTSPLLFRWSEIERRTRIGKRDRSLSTLLQYQQQQQRSNYNNSVSLNSSSNSSFNMSNKGFLNKSKASLAKKLMKEEENIEQQATISNEEQLAISKARVKQLLQKGILLFMSHVVEMSVLSEDKYKQFGQSTQFHNRNPQFFRLDRQSLGINGNGNNNGSNNMNRNQPQRSADFTEKNNKYTKQNEESFTVHEEQFSQISDRSGGGPKRSTPGLPKEILSEIKEEEEEMQNKMKNDKNNQYYDIINNSKDASNPLSTIGTNNNTGVTTTATTISNNIPATPESHSLSSQSGIEALNAINSLRQIQRLSSATTKNSYNKTGTISGGEFESSGSNLKLFDQTSSSTEINVQNNNNDQIREFKGEAKSWPEEDTMQIQQLQQFSGQHQYRQQQQEGNRYYEEQKEKESVRQGGQQGLQKEDHQVFSQQFQQQQQKKEQQYQQQQITISKIDTPIYQQQQQQQIQSAVLLHTVKEVDSIDSSVASTQIKKTQGLLPMSSEERTSSKLKGSSEEEEEEEKGDSGIKKKVINSSTLREIEENEENNVSIPFAQSQVFKPRQTKLHSNSNRTSIQLQLTAEEQLELGVIQGKEDKQNNNNINHQNMNNANGVVGQGNGSINTNNINNQAYANAIDTQGRDILASTSSFVSLQNSLSQIGIGAIGQESNNPNSNLTANTLTNTANSTPLTVKRVGYQSQLTNMPLLTLEHCDGANFQDISAIHPVPPPRTASDNTHNVSVQLQQYQQQPQQQYQNSLQGSLRSINRQSYTRESSNNNKRILYGLSSSSSSPSRNTSPEGPLKAPPILNNRISPKHSQQNSPRKQLSEKDNNGQNNSISHNNNYNKSEAEMDVPLEVALRQQNEFLRQQNLLLLKQLRDKSKDMQNNTVKDNTNKGNSASKMNNLNQQSAQSTNIQHSSSVKDNSFKANFFQFPTRDSIASEMVTTQEEKKIDYDDEEEGIKHESSCSQNQQPQRDSLLQKPSVEEDDDEQLERQSREQQIMYLLQQQEQKIPTIGSRQQQQEQISLQISSQSPPNQKSSFINNNTSGINWQHDNASPTKHPLDFTKISLDVSASRSSPYRQPSIVTPVFAELETNQRAQTKANTTSIRGNKVVLSKGLIVNITKVFSDDTVEVQFEGISAVFHKHDFSIFKDANNTTNNSREFANTNRGNNHNNNANSGKTLEQSITVRQIKNYSQERSNRHQVLTSQQPSLPHRQSSGSNSNSNRSSYLAGNKSTLRDSSGSTGGGNTNRDQKKQGNNNNNNSINNSPHTEQKLIPGTTQSIFSPLTQPSKPSNPLWK